MNPEFLIAGVLRSLLGGRRKRSRRAVRYLTRDLGRGIGHLGRGVGRVAVGHRGGGFLSRPGTLLGALGVAWGIFETLQHQGSSASGRDVAAGPDPAPGARPPDAAPAPGVPIQVPVPPIPNVAAPAPVSPDALRMVRLAVSAALADGTMSEQERAAILQQASEAGIDSVLDAELRQPRPLAAIVAGVTDPAERATLYVLAYTVVRADEQVSGAERIYLAQLANLLGLDAATVASLETETGQRIDALGDQGQLGG